MVSVSAEYVESLAFNGKSFVNSKKIVSKGQIVKACINSDGNLIFGECSGSGKSNYRSSIDFMDELKPVFRCSCPSRQIPCKHSIAVLYKYALDKDVFVEEEVPDDIQSKREKVAKKEENKVTKKPAKVNISAFIKKLEGQMECISDVDSFVSELLSSGIGNATDVKLSSLEDILCKNLKASMLGEHRYIILDCIKLFKILERNRENMSKSATFSERGIYKEIIEKLIVLKELNNKYKEEVQKLILENSYLKEESLYIFNKAGQVIKSDELEKFNLVLNDKKIIQLSFEKFDDSSNARYINTSYFIDTENGDIYENRVVIPYSAANNIKTIMDVSGVMHIDKILYYKKDLNTKVVLNSYKADPLEDKDIKTLKNFAKSNFEILLKEVKKELTKPLNEKIVSFVKANEIIRNEEYIYLKDENEHYIKIVNVKDELKYILKDGDVENIYLAIKFEINLDNREIIGRILSVVLDKKVVKI